MKKRYIVFVFLCATMLMSFHSSFAQQRNKTTIESIVEDFNGNPIANAELFSDGDYARTGPDGKFVISIANDASLLVKAKGYKPITLDNNEARSVLRISLMPSPVLFDEKIDIGFRKSYEGDITGAISTVDAKEVIKYHYSTDPNELWTGNVLGMRGANSVRGLGVNIDIGSLLTAGTVTTQPALVIVDGLPRGLDGIRSSEIESITVLKDVNAAVLYGTAAINGVILITTKRGEAYRKQADITARYGIATPRAYPKYLNSAAYMEQFNLARTNDGLTPQFTDEQVNNFRTGNKYLYPSVDYYSSEYLRSMKNSFDVNGEFSGGNNVAKYYANFGWISEGELFAVGKAADMRSNTFNSRLNADLKINDWINTEIDGTAYFYKGVMPYPSSGNYWSQAATLRPNQYVPLIPISMVTDLDPNNTLVSGRKRDVDGKYLIGGNNNYQTHPIGNLYAAGEVAAMWRVFSFNNRINFDLDKWVKGLSFKTNISFDLASRWNQTVQNQYSTYEWTQSADGNSGTLTQRGEDTNSGSQSVGSIFVSRNIGFYGLFSYDRTFDDKHRFTGLLFGYGRLYKQANDLQGSRSAHAGLQLGYTYDKRYTIDFSSAVVHSSFLGPGNRVGFSPSGGLAWVMSNEDFLSDVTYLDFLKLRVTGGVMKTDMTISEYFLYDDRLITSGGFSWYEGMRSRSGTIYSPPGNPGLTFANRKDLNIGFESLWFGNTVGLTANWFNIVNDGLTLRPTNAAYPSYYSTFVPYENYEAEKYTGFEAGLSFTKQLNHEWSVFAGANLLYTHSTRTKVDEIYENDYQYRKGRPVDAFFGLEALGLFRDQADIDASPEQLFGTVRPGDIKYKDQNNDGRIDADDEVYLGRYNAPVYGSLQLKLTYKNVSLFVLSDAISGAKGIKSGSYYWVDGNTKYSEVVLGSWTPATHNTATYPRLTTQASGNNHRNSSYWMYDYNRFDITKIQITYCVPDKFAKRLMMKNWDVFAYATQPFWFGVTDIREINPGGAPRFRSFVLGLKSNF